MGEWSSGYVEANGPRLHYTRTGGAKPPVVLAHGLSDDGLCWTPVAEALASEYDLVMVDARGHGRSDAPDQGYGPDTQATDLAGVITALGLRRPAVLGHSMGASTALVLAGTRPDLPGAILLEDPPAWWAAHSEAPSDVEEWGVELRAWLAAIKRKTRVELIAAQRAASPGWDEAELDPWADAKARLGCQVIGAFDRRPDVGIDWPATLGRIACPALLITADSALGAGVTEENGDELRTLVPGLRVAHIPGAGHNVRRDRFAPFMGAVLPFLADWAASRPD